ncbi:MAG: hypothetical protein AB7I59_02530 [Geminicoccaceae bacterium]
MRLRSCRAVALFLLIASAGGGSLVASTSFATETAAGVSEETRARFEYLSRNGNSNCSQEFMAVIPKMSLMERLQGSCCTPMDLHRYAEQVDGLKAYREIAVIPPDPYDIEAGLAAKLMSSDAMELSPGEQAEYDYAMANSAEHGPCCCRCWRWKVYGGLAKSLIRNQQFSGKQVTEIWDLSNGCGGGSDVH